jgi:hypothetical protein
MNAFIFVPTLVATVILGTFLFAYLSAAVLGIVQSAAAGADAADLPSESISEKMLKGLYLGWIAALAAPAGGAIGLLVPWPLAFAPWGGIVVGLLLAAALLGPWLLLSSLGAGSRFLVLDPDLIGGLLVRPGHILGYVVRAVPVTLAAGLAAQLLYRSPSFVWVPLAAAALAGLLLVLARLVGLLGAGARPPERRGRRRRRRVRAVAVSDPWAVPEPPQGQPSQMQPVVTPEGEVHGYDVVYHATEAEPAPARPRPIDLDDVPYEVAPAQAAPDHAALGALPAPDPLEMERFEQRRQAARRAKEAGWPWSAFLTPLRPEVFVSWVVLSGGFTMLGAMVALMIHFYPQ